MHFSYFECDFFNHHSKTLQQYEYSSANSALATIPKEELADLRSKAKRLKEAEEKIDKLEKLVKHLRECIDQLREGKVSKETKKCETSKSNCDRVFL